MIGPYFATLASKRLPAKFERRKYDIHDSWER